MERDEKIAQVKNDLRALKKLNHAIESATRTKERYERRIELITQSRGTEENKQRRLQSVEALIDKLSLERIIEETSRRESIYMGAIAQLEPLDMTIILETYINGKGYKEIASALGYTEVGIRKRASKIIEHIATLV